MLLAKSTFTPINKQLSLCSAQKQMPFFKVDMEEAVRPSDFLSGKELSVVAAVDAACAWQEQHVVTLNGSSSWLRWCSRNFLRKTAIVTTAVCRDHIIWRVPGWQNRRKQF
jgi:hypothetical protein